MEPISAAAIVLGVLAVEHIDTVFGFVTKFI